MKKILQIYSIIIVITSFAACKTQNRTDQLKKKNKEVVTLNNIYPIKKADTIQSTNAPSKITRKIRKDLKGNLLFAAYKNIIKYDGVSFTNIKTQESIASYDAFDVWQDKNETIWVASTHFGVFQYPKSTVLKANKKSFNHFTTKNGLAHNRTMCIYEDMAGGIWVGTEGGISYFNGKTPPNKQIITRNFTVKNGLTSNSINTILEDKTGKIWVGTRGTLVIYNPLSKLNSNKVSFTEVTDYKGKTFKNIWAILEDKNGTIWLGGQYGLWRYSGNSFTKLASTNITAIYEDTKENIWFTHGASNNQKAGLSRYNKKSLLNKKPKATQIFSDNGMLFGINEDKNNAIWVGKLNGVFRYSEKSVSFFKNN